MTYTDRLLWAMSQCGKTNQSELARAVGIRPQSIQYLCDPQSGARGSSHTPSLARVLGVDAQWLATGEGQPLSETTEPAAPAVREPDAAYSVTAASVPWCAWAFGGVLRAPAPAQLDMTPATADEPAPAWQDPRDGGAIEAWRVKGNALDPFVRDGQFLLLSATADWQAEDVLLLRSHDGHWGLQTLMVLREDSLLTLPMSGGQAVVVDRASIAEARVVMGVLPKRWARVA
jgi:hypothetical protein